MVQGYFMAKFLIVDDAVFMRTILKANLTQAGHEIVAEASKAVEAFKQTHPDIVTLDITMPQMDGLEALKQIMSIDPTAKVIMVSAMGQQIMVIDAIKSGAKDFIVKPFQAKRVLEVVNKLMS